MIRPCTSTRCRCSPTVTASAWPCQKRSVREYRAGGAQMTGSTGLRRFVKDPAPACQAPLMRPPRRPPLPRHHPLFGTARLSSRRPAFPAFPIGQVPTGQAQPGARPGAEEACEFCAAPIPAGHGHVADLDQSTLMCACRACYLLFTHSQAGLPRSQAGRGRYRAVPDRYASDPARPLSAAEWDTLEVPVGLAFFLRARQRMTSPGSTRARREPRNAGSTWKRGTGSPPPTRCSPPRRPTSRPS